VVNIVLYSYSSSVTIFIIMCIAYQYERFLMDARSISDVSHAKFFLRKTVKIVMFSFFARKMCIAQ